MGNLNPTGICPRGQFMASTDYDMLVFLRWLDDHAELKYPLKSEVKTLRLKAWILKVFLSCEGKWHIEDGNLKVHLTHIKNVFLNVDMELKRLWADLKWLCPNLDLERPRKFSSRKAFDLMMPMNMNDLLRGVVEGLQLLTPDVQQVYAILSRSPRPRCEIIAQTAKKALGMLTLILRSVRAYGVFPLLVKELKAGWVSLRSLRDLIDFTAKRCRKLYKLKDLLIHAEFVVDNISLFLFYLFSVDKKMNDQMVKEMKMQFSFQIHKIIPASPEGGKIYIEALRTSKSEVGTFDWKHLDYFLERMPELSSVTSNKRSMTWLYEGVQFIGTFLDESSCNFFRGRIITVIIDTACAMINLLCDDDQNRDEVREVTMAIYDLHHGFMLKRENATKIDYVYLQRPWLSLGPNEWGELNSQLEFLENQQKEIQLVRPLKHEIQLVLNELGPLKRKFIVVDPSVQEEVEVQRRRLIRIVDHANFVITSFRYRIATLWNCKLELFYIIQKIKMIKMDVQLFTDKQLSSGSQKHQILSIVGMLELEDQLRCLETHMDLTSHLKDEVRILRLVSNFLRVFLSCRGKWYIEDRKLKVILTRIQSVFQDADLRKMWADFIQIESIECSGMVRNMEHMIFSTQDMLRLLIPDIQGVYMILSKSSRFITGMTDKAVRESLNILIENLEDMRRFEVEWISPLIEELEAVENCLRFLKKFLCFTAKMCNRLGKLKDLLIHAEMLVDNISCLLYLCSVNYKQNDDQMVKDMKALLLFELQKFSPALPDVRKIYIKALESSKGNSILSDEFVWSFLDSLPDSKTASTTHIRDQILLLQKDLPFLLTYLAMDLSFEEHIENNLFERTNAVMDEIRYIFQENDIYKKISDFLYDVCFPRSFRSNFPRTNGQGYIGYLLGNLKELLNTRADLVAPLEHQIEIAKEELLSVREDFGRTANQPNQCEELQCQWIRFIDTAYHIEYVIDSFVAGRGPLFCHKLGLFRVLEETRTIKMELKAIRNKIVDDKSVPSYFPSQFSIEANSPEVNPVSEANSSTLLIFPEAAEAIIEQLTYGWKKLNFLSIVGMPGIGKTTLANSVYQNSSVTRHFHVRLMCSVGQVYDKRTLLRRLLTDQCEDENVLEQKLYQSLKGRRYLIFMDDIWDIRSWKEIRRSFPDDENGSRIMFTSRFDYIASQAGQYCINYPLSPLSEEKSWELLKSKIFGDGRCPTGLVNLGREIALNCKGLPLTVDLIAGILREKEMITREWKKVADSMKEYLHDPQGQCQKVLELSYQNLPDELRPCFLYFAAFPEDTDIRTRDLILLWIAEGFIQLQKDDQRCLEDAAEDILSNLISRSLVILAKRRRLGGVKETRIHDLLHNFASSKAKEERFMLNVDDSTLSSDNYHWRGQYRLCIFTAKCWQSLESIPGGSPARSLICFDSRESISWQLGYFKLLKVLNIPNVSYYHHPVIFTLIHLRFLAISSIEEMILSEIHKFWNLETFIMNSGYFLSKACLFLDEICSMMRLRHFCFENYFSLSYRNVKILEKSFLFDNLKTLYHVRVSFADDIEKILKLMPNLVKLKVTFYNPNGGCYSFPKLDFLVKLESLEVKGEYGEYPSMLDKFPPYLKNLVLSHLSWAGILEIGKLECLEILKLKYGKFKGATWNMIDGQFPKLRYLSLIDMNIEEWNATEDHLSCLEELHVEFCKKLKDLPLCLAEVATLQKIKLHYCSRSLQSSSKIIKEEQEAAGNDQLVVETKNHFFQDSESDQERDPLLSRYENDEEEGTSI